MADGMTVIIILDSDYREKFQNLIKFTRKSGL